MSPESLMKQLLIHMCVSKAWFGAAPITGNQQTEHRCNSTFEIILSPCHSAVSLIYGSATAQKDSRTSVRPRTNTSGHDAHIHCTALLNPFGMVILPFTTVCVRVKLTVKRTLAGS